MVAINFKKEFVDKISSGEKNQTIRKTRENPILKGDTLQLYTGMRTKECKLIKEVTCKSVTQIIILDDSIHLSTPNKFDRATLRCWMLLDEFANDDGFRNWRELKKFFYDHYGLPFDGVVVGW